MPTFVRNTFVIVAGFLAPVVCSHVLNMLLTAPLGIFSVAAIQVVWLALLLIVLRPRPWIGILISVIYLPAAFYITLLVGYKAGYYIL